MGFPGMSMESHGCGSSGLVPTTQRNAEFTYKDCMMNHPMLVGCWWSSPSSWLFIELLQPILLLTCTTDHAHSPAIRKQRSRMDCFLTSKSWTAKPSKVDHIQQLLEWDQASSKRGTAKNSGLTHEDTSSALGEQARWWSPDHYNTRHNGDQPNSPNLVINRCEFRRGDPSNRDFIFDFTEFDAHPTLHIWSPLHCGHLTARHCPPSFSIKFPARHAEKGIRLNRHKLNQDLELINDGQYWLNDGS